MLFGISHWLTSSFQIWIVILLQLRGCHYCCLVQIISSLFRLNLWWIANDKLLIGAWCWPEFLISSRIHHLRYYRLSMHSLLVTQWDLLLWLIWSFDIQRCLRQYLLVVLDRPSRYQRILPLRLNGSRVYCGISLVWIPASTYPAIVGRGLLFGEEIVLIGRGWELLSSGLILARLRRLLLLLLLV